MSYTKLKSPYVVGSQTINDGDYISLGITAPSTPDISFSITSTANYTGQSSVSRTVSSSGSADKQLYVSTTNFTGAPTGWPQPTLQCHDYIVEPNPGFPYNLNDRGLATNTITNSPTITTLSTSNVGSSDVVAAPQTGTFMSASNWFVDNYPNRGKVTDPSKTLTVDAATNTFSSSNYSAIDSNNRTPPVLCVELHANDYLALRGTNGKYLHLLPYTEADNTTFSNTNAIPSNLVLSFSDLPSDLYTAQWSLYLANSTTRQVVLVNRASNTCLTLGTSLGLASQQAYIYNNAVLFNYVYGNGAAGNSELFYNNYVHFYAQFWSKFGQYSYRLKGDVALADVASSATNNCVFTLSLMNPVSSVCSLDVNPTNTNCSSQPNYSKRMISFCQTGDLLSTPVCKTWAINNAVDSANIVAAYCRRYPGDESLCGCINYDTRYHELIQLLAAPSATSTQGTSLLPQCNVPACAQYKGTSAWASASQLSSTCITKICIQGITLGDNAAIGNTTQDCVFGSDSNASNSDDTGSSGFDLIALITPILSTVSSYLTKLIAYITPLSIMSSLLIAFVVLFVCLVFLNMEPARAFTYFLGGAFIVFNVMANRT